MAGKRTAASAPPVPWLEHDDPFPSVDRALGPSTGLEGLVAIGADLSPARLLDAYRHGIYPWYSEGQPILWWSPDPRMVLRLSAFKISRSLRKAIRARRRDPRWVFRLNSAFGAVMNGCAQVERHGQSGTWITPEMQAAYGGLHAMGHAHSFEAWHDGRLVGGGYGVAIGRMFFGESMFALETDASKLALAALVGALQTLGFRMLDCQQNTRHLASLGAQQVPRAEFVAEVASLIALGEVAVWPAQLELPAY